MTAIASAASSLFRRSASAAFTSHFMGVGVGKLAQIANRNRPCQQKSEQQDGGVPVDATSRIAPREHEEQQAQAENKGYRPHVSRLDVERAGDGEGDCRV